VSSKQVKSTFVLALVAAVPLLGGCGGGGDDKSNAAKKAAPKCISAVRPKPRTVKRRQPPSFRLSPTKTYVATVETTCGAFKIALDSKQAPITGGSFVSLARKGFYNGLIFHRVVHGFIVQGGDPTGSGSGGPGYSVRERPPRDLVYSDGIVAMAKTGLEPAGTSGSQFFVVTANDAQLEPVFALLGRVSDGLDVVNAIDKVDTDQTDAPFTPILIKKISIAVS
jgi:peptidyl-prolyl cis-trans isomerase B (cyclophilin B)